jgi:Transposase
MHRGSPLRARAHTPSARCPTASKSATTGRAWRCGAPSTLPVAIERPSGLLVDALVGVGLIVTPIHPNAVKACRRRYRTAAAKSDSGDALILADILRTEGHRLRRLEPQPDAIKPCAAWYAAMATRSARGSPWRTS